MILAIASGKGGTGKTTFAVNLARVLETEVQLLDCDVEEPNAHLFLPGRPVAEKPVTVPIPQIEEALCDGCGECGRACAYHAIVSFGPAPLVFPSLCHGCGGCSLACSRGAIRETPRRVGVVETSRSGAITLIQGRMDVGVASAPPLIRAVKAERKADAPTILDAPPGTSCPMIAAVRGADFTLLVTEPTPFGLNDLKLAVAALRELGIPFGVALNRAGSGDGRVGLYCEEEGIPLLAQIPDDRRIARASSEGRLIVEALPRYRPHFATLWERIEGLLGERRRRAATSGTANG